MQTVAVLFARADSNYKSLPGTDVYDIERDARTYDGPHPVVAHPLYRAWGRLRLPTNGETIFPPLRHTPPQHVLC
jgi:hypothetical protein